MLQCVAVCCSVLQCVDTRHCASADRNFSLFSYQNSFKCNNHGPDLSKRLFGRAQLDVLSSILEQQFAPIVKFAGGFPVGSLCGSGARGSAGGKQEEGACGAGNHINRDTDRSALSEEGSGSRGDGSALLLSQPPSRGSSPQLLLRIPPSLSVASVISVSGGVAYQPQISAGTFGV